MSNKDNFDFPMKGRLVNVHAAEPIKLQVSDNDRANDRVVIMSSDRTHIDTLASNVLQTIISNDPNKESNINNTILGKFNEKLKEGWTHIRLNIKEDEDFGEAIVEDMVGRPRTLQYDKESGEWS